MRCKETWLEWSLYSPVQTSVFLVQWKTKMAGTTEHISTYDPILKFIKSFSETANLIELKRWFYSFDVDWKMVDVHFHRTPWQKCVNSIVWNHWTINSILWNHWTIKNIESDMLCVVFYKVYFFYVLFREEKLSNPQDKVNIHFYWKMWKNLFRNYDIDWTQIVHKWSYIRAVKSLSSCYKCNLSISMVCNPRRTNFRSSAKEINFHLERSWWVMVSHSV